jgi:hypothetical protein
MSAQNINVCQAEKVTFKYRETITKSLMGLGFKNPSTEQGGAVLILQHPERHL